MFKYRFSFKLISFFLPITLLMAVGLLFFRDFGISYDEPVMRYIGLVTAKQIFSLLPSNFTNFFSGNSLYSDLPQPEVAFPELNFHPRIFEAFLVFIEFIFGFTDDKINLWQNRHLISYAVCAAGYFFFYRFLKGIYGGGFSSYTILGFLLLSPRIFADSFYNAKDMVFLTTYLVSSIHCIKWTLNPSTFRALIAGFTVGLSASLRPVGLIIIPISLLISILWSSRITTTANKDIYKSFSILSSLSLLAFVLFQPYLWSSTFSKLSTLPIQVAKFQYDTVVLLGGRFYPTESLPWFYLPFWIAVTVPLTFLFLFFLGFIFSILNIIYQPTFGESLEFDSKRLIDCFFGLSLLLPLFIAILFDVTLYNGWRHFYFIYPAMAYFMFRACHMLINNSKRWFRLSIMLLVIISFSSNSIWIYEYRGLQSLYFNAFAGKNVEERFELDYFSVSGKQILKDILEMNSSPKIRIYDLNNAPLYDSRVLLPLTESKRLEFLRYDEGFNSADYVVTRNQVLECEHGIRSCRISKTGSLPLSDFQKVK